MKWTEEHDKTLRDCAGAGLTADEAGLAVDRTGSACAGRARRLKLSFNSTSNIDLRNFIGAGGRLIREDIGGVVGVRWARAHRSGPSFHAPACEWFLRLGLLRQDGAVYLRASLR